MTWGLLLAITKRTRVRGTLAASAAVLAFLGLLASDAALIAGGVLLPVVGFPIPVIPVLPESLVLWLDGLLWAWAGASLAERGLRAGHT